ncbi:hypothetical protein [Actinomyces minihominis]|uniref:hypothetical protein n=1 Tax=Actinomyces minihominis TaxID=2002838 RepID=UPI000C06F02A|nr:hypothetical protein [Actinomyces minihominis]
MGDNSVGGAPNQPVTGVLFGAPLLLPSLTVRDNISLPWRLAGIETATGFVESLVVELSLRDRLDRPASELVEDEAFRVSIARALAGEPEVLYLYPQGPDREERVRELLRTCGRSEQVIARLGDTEFSAEPEAEFLPASLDDIAPPRGLSATQEMLVNQARHILEQLPGPMALGTDPFATELAENGPSN